MRPIGNRFDHGGAPTVLLNASTPEKNIAILSGSLKDLPKKTVIRGDWNNHGQPNVFFLKKGSSSSSKIDDANIRYQRAELLNFIDVALRSEKEKNSRHTPAELNAIYALSQLTATSKLNEDINVEQIREPLNVLAKEMRNAERRKKINTSQKHKFGDKKITKIINLRLAQFVNLDAATLNKLMLALFPSDSTMTKERKSEIILSMQNVIDQYLNQMDVPRKSLEHFLRHSPDPINLRIFANKWQAAVKYNNPSIQMMRILVLSWSKELGFITKMVLADPAKTLSPTLREHGRSNLTPRYRRTGTRINGSHSVRPLNSALNFRNTALSESSLVMSTPESDSKSPKMQGNRFARLSTPNSDREMENFIRKQTSPVADITPNVSRKLNFDNDDGNDNDNISQPVQLAQLRSEMPWSPYVVQVNTAPMGITDHSLSSEESVPSIVYERSKQELSKTEIEYSDS